jgi:hypothetical protein
MKTLGTIAIGLLAAANLVSAQANRPDSPAVRPYFASVALYQTVDVEKLQAAILASLGSENFGVIESALAHAAHLRIARPDIDMSDIRKVAMALAADGPTAVIRYRAHLVGQVCCDPATFASALDGVYSSGDEFFVNLGSRLQAML